MFLYSARMKNSNNVDFYLCENDKELEGYLTIQYAGYYSEDAKKNVLDGVKIWKHDSKAKIKGLYDDEGNSVVISVGKILQRYNRIDLSGYVETFYIKK